MEQLNWLPSSFFSQELKVLPDEHVAYLRWEQREGEWLTSETETWQEIYILLNPFHPPDSRFAVHINSLLVPKTRNSPFEAERQQGEAARKDWISCRSLSAPPPISSGEQAVKAVRETMDRLQRDRSGEPRLAALEWEERLVEVYLTS
jgi:hypothetical protein